MATNRALAARSLHIRIVPRPSNLSESREVFKLLRRYGEISMFRYLRYEYQNPLPNIAIAIFREEASARKALDASPLRFTLKKFDIADIHPSVNSPSEAEGDDLPTTPTSEPGNIDNSLDDMLRPSHLINTTLSSTPPPQATPTTTSKTFPLDPPTPSTPVRQWEKHFLLTIDYSRVVHADYIERQPFYKQFAPLRCLAQSDLEKVVPILGLSDISKRPPSAHRTPLHVLAMMREYAEQRMPLLSRIAAQAKAENNHAENNHAEDNHAEDNHAEDKRQRADHEMKMWLLGQRE